MAEMKNNNDLENDMVDNEKQATEEYEIVDTYMSQVETRFDELTKMLDEQHYADFMHAIEEMNPVDAADFFATLPLSRTPKVFKLLKKNTAAEVFAELDSDLQQKIIELMTDREISAIVGELFVDDAVDMLEEMPSNMVRRILHNTPPQARAEINKFLAYPDDSAGSVMTAEFLYLHESMTCAEAIERIRKIGIEKETIYTAYVTTKSTELVGSVDFKDLLFSSPDTMIADIMSEDIIFAYTLDDQETAAEIISKYDLLALPIVDKEKRLVGIVTVDDALDVIQEEATEDIEKMAAILPTDKPYFKVGILETFKNRIPWLLILMLSAVFTGAIITHYESAIGKYAILAAFFPMLMGTGGNAGGQTSVTIIRCLSLGEVKMGDVFRVLWKEFRVSLLCGICIGIASFIKTIIIDFRLQPTTILESGDVQNNLLISAIIGITALCAVVVAKCIGALLPIGVKRIGLDPAVMASPFITTVVDTLTLIIYFNIASRLLGF